MEAHLEMDGPKDERPRPSNLRTALVLLSIVAVFFAGIIIARIVHS